jgi:hypothetical protein
MWSIGHASYISEVDTKFHQKFAEILQFLAQSRIIFMRLQPPAPAPDESFDAALAPVSLAPALLYSKAKFLTEV